MAAFYTGSWTEAHQIHAYIQADAKALTGVSVGGTAAEHTSWHPQSPRAWFLGAKDRIILPRNRKIWERNVVHVSEIHVSGQAGLNPILPPRSHSFCDISLTVHPHVTHKR